MGVGGCMVWQVEMGVVVIPEGVCVVEGHVS